MIGKWAMTFDGIVRTAINRRASLQSPLKRTESRESPLGGFVRIARGLVPVWA